MEFIKPDIAPRYAKFVGHEIEKGYLESYHEYGQNPSWTSYEKLREVIERRMFSQVEDLLPVISFGSKKDSETEKKHGEFVERMVARGYTERQVRRLVEWYMRVKQAGGAERRGGKGGGAPHAHNHPPAEPRGK